MGDRDARNDRDIVSRRDHDSRRDYESRREYERRDSRSDLERRDNTRRRSRSPVSTRPKSPNRWDDPMKQFSEKHKPEKPPKHRAPPNRFNIPPGRQWDGIDRSNGFEIAYFKKLAQQERKKDLDYKYTVADM